MGFKLRSSGPFKMMGSSPARQTTTEQDETAGDIEINDPAGMYGPGKGKRLFEMSEKELKALGFSPKKIKEIMADGTKNPMSQEEVLEDITNPRTRTAK
jgi:hypothetical protein